jgi:hypothetical protein
MLMIILISSYWYFYLIILFCILQLPETSFVYFPHILYFTKRFDTALNNFTKVEVQQISRPLNYQW